MDVVSNKPRCGPLVKVDRRSEIIKAKKGIKKDRVKQITKIL